MTISALVIECHKSLYLGTNVNCFCLVKMVFRIGRTITSRTISKLITHDQNAFVIPTMSFTCSCKLTIKRNVYLNQVLPVILLTRVSSNGVLNLIDICERVQILMHVSQGTILNIQLNKWSFIFLIHGYALRWMF